MANPSDGKPAGATEAAAAPTAAGAAAPAALSMFGVRPKTPPASPPPAANNAAPTAAAAAAGASAANAGGAGAGAVAGADKAASVANGDKAAAAPTAAPGTATDAAATSGAVAKTDAKPPEVPKPTITKAKLPATPLGQMTEADRCAIAEVQGGETEAGSSVMTKILKVVEPYIQHLNTDEPFDLKAFNTETMTLYHAVFVACTTGQQEVNPATLYNGYLESVQGFVASVAEPKLAAGEKKAATDSEVMSESLVDAFSRMWTKHTALIKHLHKIFLYLDRCQQLLDQNILRIKPAGLNVFRTLVLEPYNTKIRDALLKGLEIEAEKRSTAQKEVILAAVTTFTEMGKEFADPYLEGTAASAKDDKLLKAHLKDMFTDTHKALLAPEPVPPQPQPQQHLQQPYDEPMNRGGGAGAKDYKRGGGGNPYANDGMPMGGPPRGSRRGGDPYGRDRDPYGRGGDPYGRDPYGRDPYGRDPYDAPYGDPYGDPYADPYGERDAYYRDGRGNGGRRHGGGGGRGGHGGGAGGGGRRAGGPAIACPTCTLENASQNYRCEACGANLPAPGAGAGAVVGGAKPNAKEPDPAKAPAQAQGKASEPDGGKADPKPAGGGGGGDADTWTCRACTFSNPSAFPRCNMCDSAR